MPENRKQQTETLDKEATKVITSRTTEDPPMKQGQKLFDFMMNKLGGENAVLMDYYKGRIAELASNDATIGQLHAEASKGDWGSFLEGMKLTAFANIINPVDGPRTEEKAARKRLTAEQKAELHEAITSYVEKNPWSSASEIANAVGVETRKVGTHLRELKNDKKLKTVGQRINMRYAVTGEKAKAPKE